MPSTNVTLTLSPTRRININRCEGEVGIAYDAKDDSGKWQRMALIALTDAQADLLAASLERFKPSAPTYKSDL